MKSTLLIGCFIFDSKSILRRYIIAPNMISWGAIVYPGLLSNLRQTNTFGIEKLRIQTFLLQWKISFVTPNSMTQRRTK